MKSERKRSIKTDEKSQNQITKTLKKNSEI